MKQVFLALVICLTGCSSAPAFEKPPVSGKVYNDLGGVVWDRANIISAMNQTNSSLEIKGYACASACLMYLSLEDVCIDRGVMFYLHGLTNLTPLVPMDPALLSQINDLYANHLPPGLKDLWQSTVKGHENSYLKIDGGSMVDRGWAKYC